jgi:membrane protease YdiL (CAAX protease family)
MSANIGKTQVQQSQQPPQTPTNGLKGTMQRHPIASYLVLMFAGLWLGYLPLLLSSHGFGILPFSFPFPVVLFNIPASLFGPLVAGIVMSRVVGGKEGVRVFRQRLFRFRFAPRWYILPIVSIPVMGIAAAAAVQGLEPVSHFISQAGGFVMAYLMNVVLIGGLVNLWEESGQIGFVLPELQRKYGAVVASLIIAPIWALMHLPALFVPEMGVGVGGPLTFLALALGMVILTAYAIPVRILATWLFNNTGESVVVVALFHAAMNSAQSTFQALVPGYNSLYLLGAFAVASFIVIALTRGKLGYKAGQAQASYQVEKIQQAAPLAASR